MKICKMNVKLDNEPKIALACKLDNPNIVSAIRENNLRGMLNNIMSQSYLEQLTLEQINLTYSRFKPKLREIRRRYFSIEEIQEMPYIEVETIVDIDEYDSSTKVIQGLLFDKEAEKDESMDNCLILTEDLMNNLVETPQDKYLADLFIKLKNSTDFSRETVFATCIVNQFMG